MDPVLESALVFACCLGFSAMMLWLNKLTGSSWGKLVSWVLMWIAIAVMVLLVFTMMTEIGS